MLSCRTNIGQKRTLFYCLYIRSQHGSPHFVAFVGKMDTVGGIVFSQDIGPLFGEMRKEINISDALALAVGLQQLVDGGDVIGFSFQEFPSPERFVDGHQALHKELGLR